MKTRALMLTLDGQFEVCRRYFLHSGIYQRSFLLNIALEGLFFIWWVKKGMFGFVGILRAAQDHNSQVVTTPFSPLKEQAVLETKPSVLKTREEAVFKRMLHPLQTVHTVMYTVVCKCFDWINHTPLICCRTVLDCVFVIRNVLSCCYLNVRVNITLFCTVTAVTQYGNWELTPFSSNLKETNSFPLCLFVYRYFLGINPETAERTYQPASLYTDQETH